MNSLINELYVFSMFNLAVVVSTTVHASCLPPLPPCMLQLLMDCQCDCTFIDVLLHQVTLSVLCCITHAGAVWLLFTFCNTCALLMLHVDLVALCLHALLHDWLDSTCCLMSSVLISLHSSCVPFLLACQGTMCFL